MSIHYEWVLLVVFLIILMSIQYTLNKIYVILKDINNKISNIKIRE
jgi:hypothetical protein